MLILHLTILTFFFNWVFIWQFSFFPCHGLKKRRSFWLFISQFKLTIACLYYNSIMKYKKKKRFTRLQVDIKIKLFYSQLRKIILYSAHKLIWCRKHFHSEIARQFHNCKEMASKHIHLNIKLWSRKTFQNHWLCCSRHA